MSSDAPWTIERIRDALGDPDLAQRFLSEINRAPVHELLSTFARWEHIAKNTLATVQRARELATHDARDEEPLGEWVDATERIQREAEQIRGYGAA
ncbi:hypothetical protein [Streptomyces malaysiensis]|uniref:Uncharacterized protein n=1 Tax=Streptomyces autolyticus TaxID=75293 RepID=A0ABM6HCI2_9ACTN|nr:hypothetical protein [Streptomyces autolyticus]AQA11700.1 hypothetical protein BV401_15665 [Streptomyces autolyticus]